MSLLYILVYIGAIAILFLFILSLFTISPYDEALLKNNMPNKNLPFLLLIIFILYNNILNYYNNIYIGSKAANSINNNHNITTGTSEFNNWEIFNNDWYLTFDINHLNQIGFLLYTEYSILFILLSFLLLFSIISAIVLTHNK